jgi:uncharacterized membrane protein YbhN (UPF0104 family)
MSRRRLVGVALGGGILLVLLATLDGAAIVRTLATATPGLVVVGVAGLTAVHLIGAATWRALTVRLGRVTLGWRSAVRLYYAGQALGGLTPANLGNDAYRAAVLRPLATDRSAVVVPIAVQRATSWIALSAIGLAALPLVAIPADVPAGAVIAVAGAAGLALAAAGFGWLRRPGEVPPAVTAGIGWAAAIGLAGGLAFHLAALGSGYLLVLAVDPGASAVAPAVIASLAVARVSLIVPLTPSGLGIGEAILAVLFTGIGLAPETAVAASLLGRLGLVLTTLIGSAALVAAEPGVAAVARPEPRSPSS